MSISRFVRTLAFALAVSPLILTTLACEGPVASGTGDKDSGRSGRTEFDAARAYSHVKRLVEIGPRPPGSDAIKKTQEFISSELKSYGVTVSRDCFDADTPKGNVPMCNIIGEIPGKKRDLVLIAGHYDSKPQPGFIGANDGGSSTATVLELARALAKSEPEYTLWFVFFDGEEAFVDWNARNGTDNTYGSRHMVSRMTKDGSIGRIKAMILVDMIGDKNLDLMRDAGSTRWLTDIVWNTARQSGYGKHFLGNESGYSDDHIPFIDAGIAAIDLIDFNYGPSNSYWHTNEDTLDKISGESMKVIGDVVILSLPEIFKRVNAGRPAG